MQEATAVLLQTMLSGLAQNCPGLGLVPPLAPGPGAPHMNVCLVILFRWRLEPPVLQQARSSSAHAVCAHA